MVLATLWTSRRDATVGIAAPHGHHTSESVQLATMRLWVSFGSSAHLQTSCPEHQANYSSRAHAALAGRRRNKN